ncbi:MAG: hypothetical protein ACFE8B_07370 [Candidatus Hermodarchaeota archaeon]
MSNGEGKTVKCGLEEIVMILEVLEKKIKTWSTVHSFKEEKTPISINWEGDSKIWFNVGDYPKMLSFPQIKILKLLLNHILEEKIIFSTTPDMNKSSAKTISKSNNKKLPQTKKLDDGLTIQEEMNIGNNLKRIEGRIIGETDKALRITIDNGEDVWIPKSIIKSQYNTESNAKQTFLIDSWFLEKNNLVLQTA